VINYDAFGNITSESNTTFGDRYKWTGREFDSLTGLQYNRARAYDAPLGRWTGQDPIGFGAGDDDIYRYVNNNPLQGIDPSGLDETQNKYRQGGIDITGDEFINGDRLGKWLPEYPGPPFDTWEFMTNWRTFGGDYKDSKVFGDDLVKPRGRGVGDGLHNAGCGRSLRRVSTGFPGKYIYDKPLTAKSDSSFTQTIDRQTGIMTIVMQVSGAYPYILLSPALKFTLTVYIEPLTIVFIPGRGNLLSFDDKVWGTIEHTVFPDCEVRIDGTNYVSYKTPDPGPTPVNLTTKVTDKFGPITVDESH
jgi:RHS repeat-associated protein